MYERVVCFHVTEFGEDDALGCGEQLRKVRPPWCRVRFRQHFGSDSKTQNAYSDLTDVNAIVARFERTGYMPPARMGAQYADVTALQVDLTEAIERSRSMIAEAKDFAANWKPPVVPPATPAGESLVPPAAS